MEMGICMNCGRDGPECVCAAVPYTEENPGEYEDDDEEEDDFATEVRNLQRNSPEKGTSHGNWNY